MTDLLTKLDEYDELDLAERIALVRGAYTPRDVCEQFEIPVVGSKIRSPFNEADKTPSCHLYDDGWFDYSTGKWGDVIDLAVQLTGQKPGIVLRQLAKGIQDMELDPDRVKRAVRQVNDLTQLYHELKADPLDIEYWVGRIPGVPAELMLDLYECDYLAQDAAGDLLIPHWSPGWCHGIKVRHRDGRKTSVSGSSFSERLYTAGKDCARTGAAVITEGESDCWALETRLSVDVYALPSGAGLWRDAWLEQLADYETICTAFDNDRAGQQATEKVRSSIGWGRWKELKVPTLYNDVREAIVAGWEPKL